MRVERRRSAFVVLVLALALAKSVHAAGESATVIEPARPSGASAWTAPASVVYEAAEQLQAAAGEADGLAGIWVLSAGGMAGYAGYAFARGEGMPWLAVVGVAGALVSAWNEWGRSSRDGAAERELRRVLGNEPPSFVVLPAGLKEDVGGLLLERQVRMREMAGGALRAGCILPVLLAGVGVFGLTWGSPAGQDLAGVALTGALGIGGPAVLYYSNIQRDLDRMDALLQMWQDQIRPVEEVDEISKEGFGQ